MFISNLKLKNWRNFREVDVPLQKRQFIVGPNASGKSNLLDVFRFLHDIAKQKGGGLQLAIERRGGISKLRCLSARRDPEVVIEISLSDSENAEVPKWRYEIGIKQEQRGLRQPYVSREKVWKNSREIISRPDNYDGEDKERLKQTYLQQVNNNRDFREIVQFLDKVTYMHLIPQMLRHSDEIQGKILEDDPFGQSFLDNMAKAPKRSQASRLNTINKIMTVAVPKLKGIGFERDEETGRPHITALYSHWRPKAGKQKEDQFSDGTLRLIALIWSLLEGKSTLLLEEPELSLHAEIVKKLAALLYKTQRKTDRQVLISTHSMELLSDEGIGGEEILMLTPTEEGTEVEVASDNRQVRSLLESGIPPGDVVIPSTKPKDINQRVLDLF